MALQFPTTDNTVIGQENTATRIDRTWRINRIKNRWELVSDVSRTLTAELPVVVSKGPRGKTIEHSFDIDNLNPAN